MRKLTPKESASRRQQSESASEQVPATKATWRDAKRPIFKFVFGFAGLMGLFAAFFYGFLTDTRAFEWYLAQNARASAIILNLFGEEAKAVGAFVRSSRFQVEIRHGCDAILPAGLFATAVLAFPVALRLKWPGIILGTIILMSINLVRIVSLYYVGVYWPRSFHTMHVDVWQPAFVFLALFLWILWGLWATQPATATKLVDQPTAS